MVEKSRSFCNFFDPIPQKSNAAILAGRNSPVPLAHPSLASRSGIVLQEWYSQPRPQATAPSCPALLPLPKPAVTLVRPKSCHQTIAYCDKTHVQAANFSLHPCRLHLRPVAAVHRDTATAALSGASLPSLSVLILHLLLAKSGLTTCRAHRRHARPVNSIVSGVISLRLIRSAISVSP